MSSTVRSRTLLFSLALAFMMTATTARPAMSLPRHDLWSNPACKDPQAGYTGSRVPISDYNGTIVTDFEQHKAALYGDVRAAYRYANAHCLDLLLGDGDAALEQGRFHEAFTWYRDFFFPPGGGMTEIGPPDFDTGAPESLRTGLDALSHDEYRSAVAAFKTSISKSPGFIPAHYLLGNVYFAEGRIPEARREWLAALESSGMAIPEKATNHGPDAAWLSALRMFELHD